MSKIVSKFLGVDEYIIEFFDHHKSHAFYSYHMSSFSRARFYLLPPTVGREETLQLPLNKDGSMRKLGLIQTAILLVFIGI